MLKTILSFCLKCKKKTVSKNPRTEKTKSKIIMLSSKCLVFGTKKSRFIKKKEVYGFLTGLIGINSPF